MKFKNGTFQNDIMAVPFHVQLAAYPDLYGIIPPGLFCDESLFLDPIDLGDVVCERHVLLFGKIHPMTHEALTPDQMKIVEDINWSRRHLVISTLSEAIFHYCNILTKKEMFEEPDVRYFLQMLTSFQLCPLYDLMMNARLGLTQTILKNFSKFLPHVSIFLEHEEIGIRSLFVLAQYANRLNEFYGFKLIAEMIKIPLLIPIMSVLVGYLDERQFGNDSCFTSIAQFRHGLIIPAVKVEACSFPIFIGLGTDIPEDKHANIIKLIRSSCAPFGIFDHRVKIRVSRDSKHRAFAYVNFLRQEDAKAASVGLDGTLLDDIGPLMVRVSPEEDLGKI